MPEKQSPGPLDGGTRATAADLNTDRSQYTADDPLLDPQWAEWGGAAQDDDLLSVYSSARLRLADVRDDPDAAEPGEFEHLVRQAHTLTRELQRRATERGGAFRDGRIVTFENTPITDLGNAERLVAHFGDRLHYCHDWGKWLVWDGRRWQVDASAGVMRLAKRTVRLIYREAAAHPDEKARREIAAWASRSESRIRLEAMIALATSEPGIPVTPDALDRDPFLLTCQNGTLELRTGRLREHRRDDLITKLAPVPYDHEAACPIFDAFLSRVLPEETVRAFIQRAAGYALTGSTRERALLMLLGIGRNGKSTLLEALRAMFGDYAMTTPTEMLMSKRERGIPNDVARLKGARLVTASETEDGRRLAESQVKQLTGSDTVTARFLHAEFFDFRPEFKLWLATNHRPEIRGTDDAIWDRVRLVPFNVRIPDGELDPELPAKLRAELPGILRWAVGGCLAWQRDGLGTPEAVKEATGKYRAEMDVLAAWVTDRCVTEPSSTVTSWALYESYKAWCEGAGERPMSQKNLASRLEERGYSKAHTKRGTVWSGIGLVTDQGPVTDRDTFSGIFPMKPPHKEKIPENPSPPVIRHQSVTTPSRRCLDCGRVLSILNESGYCGTCAGQAVSR